MISSIYNLLQSCSDLKFGNYLVNFEFSFHVCFVKDELLRLDTFEKYVNQSKNILDHFSLLIRIFMHFAGFSLISKKNVKSLQSMGFRGILKLLESWNPGIVEFFSY
jgi:hypothetical protein